MGALMGRGPRFLGVCRRSRTARQGSATTSGIKKRATCGWCGAELAGRQRLWCSMGCAAKAWYRAHSELAKGRAAARRRARGVPTLVERKAAAEARRARFCRACGDQLVDRKRRYCSIECRIAANEPASARHAGLLATTRELVCARPGCEAPFSTRKPNRRYCSPACRQAEDNRRNRPGRGAGRRFPRVRYAARRAIFERDGWRCQPCGAPIDPALEHPHPGSASIDHRDPDGPHEPANWQAAHLACNVSKGRKVAPGADPGLRRLVA